MAIAPEKSGLAAPSGRYIPSRRVSKINLRLILQLLFKQSPRSYLILDGLDECEPDTRKELLGESHKFISAAQILILSRAEVDRSERLREIGKEARLEVIQVDESDNQSDIHKYIITSIETKEPPSAAMHTHQSPFARP